MEGGGDKHLVGGVFLGGGMSKFSPGGADSPILLSTEDLAICYFCVYMIHHSCLYDSVKTTCFGKIFLKLYTKMLSAIRLQDF